MLDIKKYTWNFNENAEIWSNDTFDTVEECIADANRVIDEGKYNDLTTPEKVFVGVAIPYIPSVDAESVLDALEEQASDFGEAGDDWVAYNPKNKDELDELASGLTAMVTAWLEKYGYTPSFYSLENVKPYFI